MDETASDLVAFGEINLTQMTDTLNQKYPATRKAFWNVSGIAYHDFTGESKTDVLIGLSGYQDKGLVYNGEKQLVEDTGSGFAYFHKVQEKWKLIQVELVEGKHYVGFEGAGLMGGDQDQLVVYSAAGVTQIANIYNLQADGQFHAVTRIASTGMGARDPDAGREANDGRLRAGPDQPLRRLRLLLRPALPMGREEVR